MDLKSIRKVNLKKDDVVVLDLKQDIPTEAIQRMKEYLKSIFPDNKAIVLCNGVDLSVVRKKN